MNPSPGQVLGSQAAPSLFPTVAAQTSVVPSSYPAPSPWRLIPTFNCCYPFRHSPVVLAQTLSFHLPTFPIIITGLSGNETVPSASLLPHSLTLLTPVAFTPASSQPHHHTSSHVSTKGSSSWPSSLPSSDSGFKCLAPFRFLLHFLLVRRWLHLDCLPTQPGPLG